MANVTDSECQAYIFPASFVRSLSEFMILRFWASVRNREFVSRGGRRSAAAWGLCSTHGGQNFPETLLRFIEACL